MKGKIMVEKKKIKKNNADKIKVLEELEAVRLKQGM